MEAHVISPRSEPLTIRERKALAVLATSSYQEIAGRIAGCSDRTLRRYALSAQFKLGARSLMNAVALAILDGYLTRDDLVRPYWERFREQPCAVLDDSRE